MAISGEVDTCSTSTGDGWIRIGKEQVSVPVRHEIEDLNKTRGIRIRFGGLNKVRRNMIVRTQMTFGAYGEKFTPSKVGAQFSTSHDPGALGRVGRYRGVPLPYGSADFEVPDDIPDKITYIHKRAYPYLVCMREAGAEEFWLHITYHYDAQCALGLSKDELRMILELDCDLRVDCIAAESTEPLRQANRRQP